MVMAAGSLVMIPAAAVPSYTLVLAALLVIAAGAALLEVAANPYVTAIGPPETASFRLNLVQAFNSMGTALAPLFGGWLILSRSRLSGIHEGAATLSQSERLADAQSVELPYLLMAAVLVTLAVLIARCDLPDIAVEERRLQTDEVHGRSLWHNRNFVWGVIGISVYEVAENGCANLFIDFVSQPNIGNLIHTKAADYLFLLWGGMMVGRFAGSAIMRKLAPDRALAVASMLAFMAMLLTVFESGSVAMWALISVGLFHSIMFPTIFTLAIRGLGLLTDRGSGLLIMAIGGGVFVLAQGWLADHFGTQMSFLLPAACELYILAYALWGSRSPSFMNSSLYCPRS